ncbi:hypothetical protein ACRE_084120 [Hapsidospora chrysogenum ATCC 11550]|uniref:FAM192A/Fyv6 N-terminal domain-containing protein n=1 Tax=Hapsidospora chrysogenum (strain ATCC 11550 / CBS 779.69 / DSM 880 / IAM 14645 / JCM 23072 / IMI 49137) TaxID=857340 RepID=A0A086SUU2_HAPC1|nr:hypothetical protein ACRE_084120 [Hapsidospora chrysogenum ATCC 11550]
MQRSACAMSSRFVSGGTISTSLGKGGPEASSSSSSAAAAAEATAAEPSAASSTAPGSTDKGSRSAEWEAAQKNLEAERQRREEQRRKAATGEEKSLYEILQENKAAKQAAFEEQNKIRNQFRALDDDEVDFLDEVREKKRKEEERVRRETEERLKAFRERQKSGDGDEVVGNEGELVESWGVGRKRKRVNKEKGPKGFVKRRVSGAEGGKEGGGDKGDEGDKGDVANTTAEKTKEVSSVLEQKKPGLSLVDYGSDDSD